MTAASALVNNLLLLKEAEELAEALAPRPVVLLKGAALLAAAVRDARSRPMEDADVLVRPRDRAAAEAALRALGFARMTGYLQEFRRDGLVIDLHTRLWYLTEEETEAFIASSSPRRGERSLVPESEDHLVFLLAHAAVHHGSLDPRWAEDIRASARSMGEAFDAERLKARLRALGLWPAARWFLSRSGLELVPATPSRGPWDWLLDMPSLPLRGHVLEALFLRDGVFRARHLARKIFPGRGFLARRHEADSELQALKWRWLRPAALAARLLGVVFKAAARSLRLFDPRLIPRDSRSAGEGFRRLYDVAEAFEEPAWEPWESELLAGPLAAAALGKKVLDVGCGSGREAILLSQRGFIVHGIDTSAAMVEAARQAALRLGASGCEFAHADPETAELGNRRYDAVYLTRTLYSSFIGRSRRLALLDRVRDALVPGGRLVLCAYTRPAREGLRVEAAWRLRRLLASALGRYRLERGDCWMRLPSSGEAETLALFHRFAPGEIEAELRSAGFQARALASPGAVLGVKP